jgi:hypothetical protein
MAVVALMVEKLPPIVEHTGSLHYLWQHAAGPYTKTDVHSPLS